MPERHTNKEGNNCRNKLDIFAYNEEEEEARNTTEDSRDPDWCDDDNDCVSATLQSYYFTETASTFGDGLWVLTIHNEKVTNDQKIESFVIILHYK